MIAVTQRDTTVRVTKRAPGLSAADFRKILRAGFACPQARCALRHKTLAQFWQTSDRAEWMAFWLFDYIGKGYNEISGICPWPLLRSCPDKAAADRVRAAYHWDGTPRAARRSPRR